MSPIQREIAEIAYDAYHNGEIMIDSDLSEELESRGFSPESGKGLVGQSSITHNRDRKERNKGIDDEGCYCWQ